MVVDYQEKILELAKVGPLQPQAVAKALETNSIMSSAMLGELASKGILKISHLSIGSSPLYYLPEHNFKLQNFAHTLNDKEKRAYELLKQKLVLRDSALDPLNRVCLRNIKDFAQALEVNHNNIKEIFWKWYLLPEEQAAELIKLELNIAGKKEPAKEIPAEEPKKIIQEQLTEVKYEQPKITQEIVKEEQVKKVRKKRDVFNKVSKEEKTEEVIKEEPKEDKEEQKKQVSLLSDFFYQKLKNYFDRNGIKVLEHSLLKKNSEHDFVLQVPSSVGPLHYYCKAKNKKTVSDFDLSTAFVQGQLKKLPTLYLSEGELTKKAEKTLDDLKGVAVGKV